MNSNLDKSSDSNNNFFNDHPVSIHFLLWGGDISPDGNNSPLPFLLNISFFLF